MPWIGRVGLEKHFLTVCYKMHGWKDVLKVEYNDPHKYASVLHGFPFALRTNTVDHLWESKFDSHKWPTVLVDEVKGKPRNFEAYLCESLYSTFKTSFQPCAFYSKRLHTCTLFKDQLDRSKAMCSLKKKPSSAKMLLHTVK